MPQCRTDEPYNLFHRVCCRFFARPFSESPTMKRRHLLAGAAAVLHMLQSQCIFAQEPAALTRDVFAGDFPPASYGQTFEEVEATVQEVIERVFRDEDGILRSGVNGRTMRPLTNDEVLDRPNGKGAYTEHSAMPDALKAVWLNYENAGEASGAYLMALCLK